MLRAGDAVGILPPGHYYAYRYRRDNEPRADTLGQDDIAPPV
jgi:hypothetical protein